jgi:hypothetical protein
MIARLYDSNLRLFIPVLAFVEEKGFVRSMTRVRPNEHTPSETYQHPEILANTS